MYIELYVQCDIITYEQIFIRSIKNKDNRGISPFAEEDIMEKDKHDHSICGGENIEKVERLMDVMPVDEEVYELAELFKMLSDSTRVKILYSILDDEMCVCDIAELVGTSQSAVSHQLRVLKQARLVKYRRHGKTVMYSVSDEHVATILSMGMEHISE